MKGRIKLRIIQIYVHASALKKTEILELYDFIYNLMNDGTKNGFYPVLMGDFNADLIKYNNTYVQQSHVPWKFLLTKYLNDSNYIETYSLFHDINAPTWNRNDLSACLDQIWISPSLQMDILYADILSPLIYDTDHKIVTAQFITSGIFSMPTRANDKRNKGNAPSRFVYKNMDQKKWDLFTAEVECLTAQHESLLSFSKTTKSVHTINRMWDQISKVILQAAKATIPFNNGLPPRRDDDNLPSTLFKANSQMRYVSKILMKMSERKRSNPDKRDEFCKEWTANIRHKLLLMCSDIKFLNYRIDRVEPDKD